MLRRPVGPLLALLYYCSIPVSAQTVTTGTITGFVYDQQGAPIAGVLVTATSRTVSIVREAQSSVTGEYRLTNLTPGVYDVSASLAGFSNTVQSGVDVRAGLTLGLELTLAVAEVAERLTVTQSPPLLEARSATTAVNISGAFQSALPLSTKRNWADALSLAPGVSSTEGRNQYFYLHGADFASNVLLVDGYDTGSASVSTIEWTDFNTDAISDVQIKTAGVDASSPLGLGAVISVVTKSGSDNLNGTVAAVYQARWWNDRNAAGGTFNGASLLQPDASLGAPVVRGRSWLFGSYRHARSEQGASLSATQIANLRIVNPQATVFDSVTTNNAYLLKSSTRLGASNTLDATVQHDRPTQTSVHNSLQGTSGSSPGGFVIGARQQIILSDRLFSTLMVSSNSKSQHIAIEDVGEPLRNVYSTTALSGGRLTGIGVLAATGAGLVSGGDLPSRVVTIAGDLSYYRDWVGAHELKAGVYLQPLISADYINRYVNGGFVQEDVVLTPMAGTGTIQPFHRRYYEGTDERGYATSLKDLAFYIQDSWRPLPRATITAGVRVDVVRRRDDLVQQMLQRSTEVGPRLGINIALTKNNRDNLIVSFGRIHEMLSQAVLTLGSSSLGYRDEYDLNFDGTFETVFEQPAATLTSTTRQISADLHQPHVDELSGAYQHQIGRTSAIGVNVTRREFRDRLTLVEINRVLDGTVFKGYANDNARDVYRYENNVWNWPVVSSAEFTAASRLKSTSVLASYMRSWRRLAGTWTPGDPAGLIQPDAFPNSRGLGGTAGTRATASGSLDPSSDGQSVGPRSQWQDHVFRAGVTHVMPWGLTASLHYVLASGAWSGPVYRRLSASDPLFGPPTVPLSNGTLVPNPLATIYRFAGNTRTDQQFELPTYGSLNVRLGYRRRVGRTVCELFIDGFNIANNDAYLSVAPDAQLVDSPSFGQGTTRQRPRSGQLTFKVQF